MSIANLTDAFNVLPFLHSLLPELALIHMLNIWEEGSSLSTSLAF